MRPTNPNPRAAFLTTACVCGILLGDVRQEVHCWPRGLLIIVIVLFWFRKLTFYRKKEEEEWRTFRYNRVLWYNQPEPDIFPI